MTGIDSDSGELRLILFSAMGIRMAVDTDQITGMIDPPATGGDGVRIVSLARAIGYEMAQPASPLDSKCLLLRDLEETAVLVDNPSSIVAINLDQIREIPLLIRKTPGLPFWGAALIDNSLILLIDIYKALEKESPSHD